MKAMYGLSLMSSSSHMMWTAYSPGSLGQYLTSHDPSFWSSYSIFAWEGPSMANPGGWDRRTPPVTLGKVPIPCYYQLTPFACLKVKYWPEEWHLYLTKPTESSLVMEELDFILLFFKHHLTMKVNEQTFLLAIWQHTPKTLKQCPPFPPLNPLKGHTKRFDVACSLQGYTKCLLSL